MSEREPLADEPIFEPVEVILLDQQRRPVRRPRRAPAERRIRLSLILFACTCVSTFVVGAIGGEFFPDPRFFAAVWGLIGKIGAWPLVVKGLSYSVPVMGILLFHEMGHYLQARRHHVPASPPFFIPMPLSPFGTMGAVILQGAGVADRRQMFDIAISGPLAGLVLAIPIAWYGVTQSTLAAVEPGAMTRVYGDPLILTWMCDIVHGPRPENVEVVLNPMLFAGWVGIFITALNLIPIGQLDGGHILYCLVGRQAHTVAMTFLTGSLVYMVWTGNYSYMFIVLLLMFFGPLHPPTADDSVPLGPLRTILGWLTLGFIIIGFTPTPIVTM